MKNQIPTVDMLEYRNGLIALLNRHTGSLDASVMMALAAYTVGQILAMQDARKYTPGLAMEIVAKNIEAGNMQAIDQAALWMPSA